MLLTLWAKLDSSQASVVDAMYLTAAVIIQKLCFLVPISYDINTNFIQKQNRQNKKVQVNLLEHKLCRNECNDILHFSRFCMEVL